MSSSLTIQLDAAALAGGKRLEPGTYRVTLDEAAATLRLVSDSATVVLPARLRSSKPQVRHPSVRLWAVEREPRWLIVVRMPPAVEWVASLDRAP